MRKEKLIQIGLLDEDCPSMQEWDTHLRLSNIAKYTTLQEPLLDYSLNGADAITSDKRREVAGRMYILQKFIQEWREDKIVLQNFLIQICMYIHSCKSFKYQVKATWQLLKIEPRVVSAIFIFWKNKVIRFVQKRI